MESVSISRTLELCATLSYYIRAMIKGMRIDTELFERSQQSWNSWNANARAKRAEQELEELKKQLNGTAPPVKPPGVPPSEAVPRKIDPLYLALGIAGLVLVLAVWHAHQPEPVPQPVAAPHSEPAAPRAQPVIRQPVISQSFNLGTAKDPIKVTYFGEKASIDAVMRIPQPKGFLTRVPAGAGHTRLSWVDP